MHRGYFKFWRCFQDNPRANDPKYVLLWIWLLMLATHKPRSGIFKGERITIKPGQFLTGRKFLVDKTKINRSKIERLLKIMEIEHQIEQQSSNVNRLITIVNWNKYQQDEQQSEQPVSNQRATSEQPVSTNKNDKNDKNDKNKAYVNFEKFTLTTWNLFCNDFPTLPRIQEITPKRRSLLKKRFEQKSFKDFDAIIKAIKEQPFLNGKNNRNWKVNFDWIISNDTNYVKILERKYKNDNDTNKSIFRS